jgi:hypothetical protein
VNRAIGCPAPPDNDTNTAVDGSNGSWNHAADVPHGPSTNAKVAVFGESNPNDNPAASKNSDRYVDVRPNGAS